MICMGLILLFFLMFISAQYNFINTKTNTVGDSPISRLQGPEISNVVINPNTPEWYDNITITVQIQILMEFLKHGLTMMRIMMPMLDGAQILQ